MPPIPAASRAMSGLARRRSARHAGRARPAAAPPRGQWTELKGCRVGGHVLTLVLLHPRFGIAIGGGPVDAVALVRQRLDRARFPAIFPGTLPVLRLATLDSPAERAFAAVPPLALPGGEAWVAMARLALETEASPALPARVGIRARRRRQRNRMLLAGGLAFLLMGAGGLGLALLTPEPSPLLATHASPGSCRPGVHSPGARGPAAGAGAARHRHGGAARGDAGAAGRPARPVARHSRPRRPRR